MQNHEGLYYLPQTLWTDICLSIFEITLDELFILKKLNTPIKMKKLDQSLNKSKHLDNTSTKDDLRVKSNLEKFEKNFAFIERTLQTAYEEMKSKGTYENLLQVVKTLKEAKRHEVNLKEETKTKHSEQKNLKYTLYDEEIFYHNKIATCMAEIGKIKDEIEDFLVESEIKAEYIEKWQNSKMEMNEILLQKNEDEKMSRLKKLDGDLYKETRVHQEILGGYKEMQKDIQGEIDKWKEKYNMDCKELQTKIQELQDKREKQREATRNLKERYAKREKEINDFKEYKIRMEEKRKVLEQQNAAATKIQAWWRGTMVRKGFGKYRKKDKKGKKKEKQEKK